MSNRAPRPVLVFLILFICIFHHVGSAQTAASPWQAKYATGGTSTHVGEVCWLTWGSSGGTVANGTYYWNLTPAIQAVATITGLTSDGGNATPLVAYNTGSYSGDGLQILYSGVNPIGLRDRVSGDGVTFNISIKILINGVSVPYPGMVIGDAESMAVGEYISAETAGSGWQVLDLRNAAPASTQSDYQLVVSNLQKKFSIQTVNSSNQGMQAVLFAQGATSLTNVKLKGSGLAALALGLIVPFDFGDAPLSYGSAGHYINGFVPTGTTVTTGTYSIVNITKSNLIPTANVYLGSANVDADANPPAGPMANYDDTSSVDDEDGVAFTGGPLKVNQTGNYPVTISATNASAKPATIYGWIDFNVDGIFSSNEIATATVPAGTTSPVNVILNYNLNNYSYAAGTFRAGASYARFRITTDTLTNTNAAGAVDQRSQTAAADGEVEDYRVDIAAITISGNIFNDANGLTDGMVNGTAIASLSSAPAYVYFSQGGTIVYKAAVAADGSYSFSNANPGNIYSLTFSTDGSQLAGGAVSSVSTTLPSGWLNTGVAYGSNNLWGSGVSNVTTGKMTVSIGSMNNDVTGVNFGAERTPTNPTQIYIITTPTLHASKALTAVNNLGALNATDPEDGALGSGKTVLISGTSALNGNKLFYNNVTVTDGMVINGYDPSLLTVVFDNVAAHMAEFNFSFADASANYSTTAGRYSISWDVLLPLKLISFTASRGTNGITLSWTTADEKNTHLFIIQYSADGTVWKNIGSVYSSGRGGDGYTWLDASAYGATNAFYRLQIIDNDNNSSYSPVRMIGIGTGTQSVVQCYPNPTSNWVYVRSQETITAVEALSLSGSSMLSLTGNDIRAINLQSLSRGCYMLRLFHGTTMITCAAIVKQ